jgi:hypothetical protein
VTWGFRAREPRHAQAAADPIRYGLLYGRGRDLVATVAAVLDAAGLTTVDLDEVFGTKSADLLVSADGRRRLVELTEFLTQWGDLGGFVVRDFMIVRCRWCETW